MTHNVIIETSQKPDGSYRAYCVEGPMSALGFWCSGKDRQATYVAARAGMQETYPTLSLSFLHAEM